MLQRWDRNSTGRPWRSAPLGAIPDRSGVLFLQEHGPHGGGPPRSTPGSGDPPVVQLVRDAPVPEALGSKLQDAVPGPPWDDPGPPHPHSLRLRPGHALPDGPPPAPALHGGDRIPRIHEGSTLPPCPHRRVGTGPTSWPTGVRSVRPEGCPAEVG